MADTYYTSLCRAWIDHEILTAPNEKEELFEIATERGGVEYISEWVMDKLQTLDNSKTGSDLLDHIEEIDLVRIAVVLYEEYSA